jgi:hypothetical protein
VAGELRFRDGTEELGLLEPLTGIRGHAVAVGDINDDGYPDLVVGTFADRPPEDYAVRGADGPKTDQLFVSTPGLEAVEGWSVDLFRTSGAVFADLDGDLDEDLVLVRHGGVTGEADGVTELYENRNGRLVLVGELIGTGFRGRTPTVADFDSDGLLDLYISEDRYGETGGLLLINNGGLSFSDMTAGSGLAGEHALGARAADLNADSIPDLVLSEGIFINRGGASFEEVTPAGYITEPIGPDDDVAGVAVGDLNGDGLPDIVVGQHFRSILEEGASVPLRVFLNNSREGEVAFTDITDSTGIPPLDTLAPHVHIADMNNDTYPDIVTSASSDGGDGLAIFLNEGGDPPRFRAAGGPGSAQYWVAAPVLDFNRDGRLDVFALEWEPGLASIALLNESNSGHWLEVSIGAPGRGVGTVVTVESVGGDFIGRQELGVATGYSSAHQAIARFGLGSHTSVVVSLLTPDGQKVDLGEIEADVHIRWPSGCG